MELTQSSLHQYFKTWQVLRNNPSINYDRLSTEGIPVYTIIHAYIQILHNVFVGGFLISEASFSGPSPSIGSKRSIDVVSPLASADIGKRLSYY